MAGRRTGDKPLPEPMQSSAMPYDVTMAQCVHHDEVTWMVDLIKIFRMFLLVGIPNLYIYNNSESISSHMAITLISHHISISCHIAYVDNDVIWHDNDTGNWIIAHVIPMNFHLVIKLPSLFVAGFHLHKNGCYSWLWILNNWCILRHVCDTKLGHQWLR